MASTIKSEHSRNQTFTSKLYNIPTTAYTKFMDGSYLIFILLIIYFVLANLMC